ncbi:MAG: hypothetical protein FRX49_10576 [Trebouxia sp. A1-2]|nr:MAG: hypothetical protein FRX49_10576 [Trebouxia sp. A1-2]
MCQHHQLDPVTTSMLTPLRQFLRIALVFVTWQSLFLHSEAARYPDTHALPAGSKVSDPLFVHRQWKVNPKNGLLTVLVPVFPTDFELGNLRNQLRTAAQYFDINTVKEYILTAPWEKVSTLQSFVDKEWAVEFPKYHTAARVVSDGQCAPQLNKGTIYDTDRLKYPGWVKQQLVKLSCANIVTTPFYLVLDTDVFFVKHFGAQDLFKTSQCSHLSAVCDKSGKISYQAKNDIYPIYNRTEDQLVWMEASALTLKMAVPLDWREAIGVTPQILAKDVTLSLGRFIKDRYNTDSWTQYLLDELFYRYKKDYRELGEAWRPPWTEYDLYWIFATYACIWEKYHVAATVLQDQAIWSEEDFNVWQPCRDTFDTQLDGYFNLVQSRIELDPAMIWDKISACFQVAGGCPGGKPSSWLAHAVAAPPGQAQDKVLSAGASASAPVSLCKVPKNSINIFKQVHAISGLGLSLMGVE